MEREPCEQCTVAIRKENGGIYRDFRICLGQPKCPRMTRLASRIEGRGKMTDLVKRTLCYAQPPSVYEIAPCSCGNVETQWSEFAGHLWCDKCEKDFVPEHSGIFDGPISVSVCKLLGISFDRINLETNALERFDPAELEGAQR